LFIEEWFVVNITNQYNSMVHFQLLRFVIFRLKVSLMLLYIAIVREWNWNSQKLSLN
jgi:hypothetical protein